MDSNDLIRFTVSRTDSIRTAMMKITANKARAVVVVDEGKVVGVVSDGDIRRAFLKDVLPISPVEKIMHVSCKTTTEMDPQKQAEIIRREKVTVLPVVTGTNDLIDVVLASEPFFNAS